MRAVQQLAMLPPSNPSSHPSMFDEIMEYPTAHPPSNIGGGPSALLERYYPHLAQPGIPHAETRGAHVQAPSYACTLL